MGLMGKIGLMGRRAIVAAPAVLALGFHVAAKAGLQEGMEAFARRDYDVAEFEFARSSGPDASYYLGVIQVGANGGKVLAGMNALQLAIKAGHPKAEELLAVTCQGATCGPRAARECAFFETPIERSACTVGRERLRRGQQQSQARQGALPRSPINVQGNTVIEAESVIRDGNILRYRTRMTVASSDMSAVSEVGVDCIARTRIDYLITAYVGGREIARTPAGSSDMRRVFDGTRQAYELDTVCRLADSAVGGATVFPELAQANPAPAPFPAPAPAPAPATVSPAALPSPRIADLPADTATRTVPTGELRIKLELAALLHVSVDVTCSRPRVCPRSFASRSWPRPSRYEPSDAAAPAKLPWAVMVGMPLPSRREVDIRRTMCGQWRHRTAVRPGRSP